MTSILAKRGTLRVLVLSRNYPNEALPQLGIWVHRMVDAVAPTVRIRVVSPTPWVPPMVPLPERFARFRVVPRSSESPPGVPVLHPRVPLPPGGRLQALEAGLFVPFVHRVVHRLHAEEPIDVIHAHFVYPDGVVAARIGRALGIPVVTTEHAHWDPWLPSRPRVLAQVLEALPAIKVVTGVSRPVVERIDALTGGSVVTRIVPNVLDDRVFQPRGDERKEPDLILFVGAARKVKGFDVLVRALPALVHARPQLRLELVGDPFYAPYRRDLDEALALARELGVREAIRLSGPATPHGVASAMRRASVVVVPSRRESFSSVAMEAIACGTPVVATRCGGPEDFVGQGQGVLVEPGDADALAQAALEFLEHPGNLDRTLMHKTMVDRFGREAAALRLEALYRYATGHPADT